MSLSGQKYLHWQYKDSSNLSARASLHVRFSTEQYPWLQWVFDQFDIPPRASVLELGCGPGSLWRQNLERVPPDWDVTLSDASPGMVQEANQNLSAADPSFAFEEIDAQSIPYDSESFDTVVANHMLYHVSDLARALTEIWRVLKPGGRLYATTVGLKHMAELRQVPGQLGFGTSSGRDPEVAQFSLDNGASELAHWFVEIDVARRKGTLVVTEAAPLVEYVTSYTRLSDDEVGELNAYFEGKIQSDGAFRITTEAGIFKAVKRL